MQASSDTQSHLELTKLSKCFKGLGKDVNRVINDFTTTIDAGTTVAIVGSNGAGKSTLLNIVAGTVLPDTGEVRVAGRNITYLPSWKRIPRIRRVRQNPQDNMISTLTVEENFALALSGTRQRFGLRPAKGKEIRALAEERVAQLGMGLENRVTARSDSLSGGQRQAIALAIASIGEPAVILLDEHTAALDPNSAARIKDVTSQIVKDSGAAALMVTHDMSHALGHADRLLMLHAGRIVLDLNRTAMNDLTVEEIQAQFAQHAGEALPDQTTLSAGGRA
ncbi:MAG: ATP-binding cassette domain-containing protein [Mycobacterium sp.]